MKMLWKLTKEASRYKVLYIFAIISTLCLTCLLYTSGYQSLKEGKRNTDPEIYRGILKYLSAKLHHFHKSVCEQGKDAAGHKTERQAAEKGSKGGVGGLFLLAGTQPVADENTGSRTDHGIKGEDHPHQLVGGPYRGHRFIGIMT